MSVIELDERSSDRQTGQAEVTYDVHDSIAATYGMYAGSVKTSGSIRTSRSADVIGARVSRVSAGFEDNWHDRTLSISLCNRRMIDNR